MSHEKPSIYYQWSRAAITAVGDLFAKAQAKLERNAVEIIPKAQGWFYHALPVGSNGLRLVCLGREMADTWVVRVRCGEAVPAVDADGRTSAALTRPTQDAGNEDFVAYEDLVR